MPVTLKFKKVKEMENTLKNSEDTSYRIGVIRLLKKWKSEIDLKKTEKTKKLIDQLLDEYDSDLL
ncbi:MAG: hypothetical protein ABR980_13900 [Ignavibacteriaceae bacterium]|jgi:hypothetical protein